MVRARARSLLPDDIDDPDFDRKVLAWAHGVRCEMQELISMTQETITATKALIDEADRMLANL
jgi:hypothetical protein